MNMKKQTPAFTLIETFVAISVLLISLAGPLSIAAQALKSAYYARDEVTAFYLAQEAMEYAQAVRDQNYLTGQSWLTTLTPCESADGSVMCQVDFPNFLNAVCANGTCNPPSLQNGPLLVDSHGLFNAESGTPSIFTRTLSIVPVTGTPDEVAVNVRVSWVSSGITRTFQISEHLFNWI